MHYQVFEFLTSTKIFQSDNPQKNEEFRIIFNKDCMKSNKGGKIVEANTPKFT
jgi:hypothetical protein